LQKTYKSISSSSKKQYFFIPQKTMVAFSIGPINIYRYGIFYLVGFLGGYFFLKRLTKKQYFKLFPHLQKLMETKLDDILIAVILWVIIGGRVGHILIYDFKYFLQNPLDMFAIRKGGMSFIGGMTGSTIAIFILKIRKKISNPEFRLLMDAIVTIVPLGILFGRIGNFLNQELYGIIVGNRLPETIINIFSKIHIFHIYPQIDEVLRVNTNFLASFFEGAISLIMLLILTLRRFKIKKIQPGFLVAIFLLRYSFVRFMLEYLRQDSQFEFIWPFSRSQYFFIIFFALGLRLLFKNKSKKN